MYFATKLVRVCWLWEIGLEEPPPKKKTKNSRVNKSMRGNETAYSICVKFCFLVSIFDLITYANTGFDRLSVFVGGSQILPFPLTSIVVLTTLAI